MKLALEETAQSRNFYRDLYRRFVALLWLSIALNVFLTMILFYYVLQIPEPKYYATNSSGAGFVLSLHAMTHPNKTNKPLLKSDPPEEVTVKAVKL